MAVLDLTQRELDILSAGMSWFYCQGSEFLPEFGKFDLLAEIDDLANKVCAVAGKDRQSEDDVTWVRVTS